MGSTDSETDSGDLGAALRRAAERLEVDALEAIVVRLASSLGLTGPEQLPGFGLRPQLAPEVPEALAHPLREAADHVASDPMEALLLVQEVLRALASGEAHPGGWRAVAGPPPDAVLMGYYSQDPEAVRAACLAAESLPSYRCAYGLGDKATFGPQRDRWALHRLPEPFLHPSGIEVQVLPVPPPALRPLLRPLPASGPMPVSTVDHPLSRKLAEVLEPACRWSRLAELQAGRTKRPLEQDQALEEPVGEEAEEEEVDKDVGADLAHSWSIILDNERQQLSTALADLLPAFHRPAGFVDAWGSPPAQGAVRLLHPEPETPVEPDDEGPVALLWTSPSEIAVQRADRVWLCAADTGAAGPERALCGASLQACVGGLLLVTTRSVARVLGHAEEGGEDSEIVLGISGFGALDLATGQWREDLPDGVLAVTWSRDEPEDATLVRLDPQQPRGVPVEGGDRPGVLAFTRDNRLALGGEVYDPTYDGAILSCERGWAIARLDDWDLEREGLPLLGLEGLCSVANAQALEERDEAQQALPSLHYEPVPCALASVGDELWLALPSGWVGTARGGRPVLGFPVRALAFDPGGARLAAMLASDEVVVIGLDPPRLLARWPLPPISGAP